MGGEDQVEEIVIVEITRREPADGDAAGQGGRRGPVEQHDEDAGALLSRVGLDDGCCERCRIGFEQVERGGHQNAMIRDAVVKSCAMPGASIGTIGWRSAFHPGSAGWDDASTWNGMPSFLSEARILRMSSPSTRSSVSSSSRWTAGPESTTTT